MIKEQLEIEEKLLTIKMKILYESEVKEFSFKKNQTLGEIALKAMEEFGITGVELKDFRFRNYDS